MTPTAWHGNPALKAEAVTAMTKHRAADEFIQGNYALNDPDAAAGYRGCFHGCLTTDRLAAEAGVPVVQFIWRNAGGVSWHQEGERLWGIPVPLGKVLDWAFEALPASESGEFAVAATEAIPVGADLSLVLSRWMLDILADPDHGVWIFTKDGSAQRAAVEAVAALYRRRLAGDEPAAKDWEKARRAAAAYAAYAAAYAADAAYADAAYAADDAADARRTHRRWMIDRLLTHLSEAPVPAVAA